MLYCTSTVAFGATSLKGGFKLFSPLGEYGFSREGFAFVLLIYFEYLVLFSPLGEYGFSREGFAFVLLTLLQVLSLFKCFTAHPPSPSAPPYSLRKCLKGGLFFSNPWREAIEVGGDVKCN